MSNAISQKQLDAIHSQLSVFPEKQRIRRSKAEIAADMEAKLANYKAKQVASGQSITDSRYLPFTSVIQSLLNDKIKATAALGNGPQSIVNRIRSVEAKLDRLNAELNLYQVTIGQSDSIREQVISTVSNLIEAKADDTAIAEAFLNIPQYDGIDGLKQELVTCMEMENTLRASKDHSVYDTEGNKIPQKRGRKPGSKNKS